MTSENPDTQPTARETGGHADSESWLVELESRLAADAVGHRLGPLEEYLAAFPRDAETVARVYFAHRFAAISEGKLRAGEARKDGSDRIGPYRLVRPLGRGGQAIVYLAEDSRLRGRPVALKVLTDPLLGSAEALARFRREAEVASRLDHPAICRIYETGVDQAVPYIAMQFVEGQTLQALINSVDEVSALSTVMSGDEDDSSLVEAATVVEESTPPPGPDSRDDLQAILHLVERVARALHVAHSQGVIHRDIKPGNIMVSHRGDPVVLDFGLARDSGGDAVSLTRTGQFFGTPAYMSPEQLLSVGVRIDHRTDIWSLGVSLYECLTLERPFAAPTREGLYNAIQTRDPQDPRKLNSSISRDLAVVVDTALQKDRDRRYQTALDFAEDLRRVRQFEPIVARSSSVITRLRRWTQRNPALATSLFGSFVILVLALVVSLALLGEARRESQRATRALGVRDEALGRERSARQDLRQRFIEIQQMSDVILVAEILAEAADLWPPRSDREAEMDAWLARVRPLANRRGGHVEALAQLEREAPEGETGGRRRFSRPEDRWRHAVLTDLVGQLARLEEERASVTSRRERAREIRRISLEENAAAWARCRREIGASEGPYSGLELTPQEGLVPLGIDRRSGFWEFWLVDSGPAPAWSGEDWVQDPAASCRGAVELAEDSGLVFVLLPGGDYWMGNGRGPAEGRNVDPMALGHEGPYHLVRLDPFFMGKYEVTQAQWRAIMGDTPSQYRKGSMMRGETFTDRHPVTDLGWPRASEMARRSDAMLPTEVQWEYAARGGRLTAFWCGPNAASIHEARAGNIADVTCRRQGASIDTNDEVDDGFYGTAPVGSLTPNPFGLYDVIGNVWEWCRDRYAGYRHEEARDGDGLRDGKDNPNRLFRGGSHFDVARFCRHANRNQNKPAYANSFIGLRLSRPIR